jgi:hypothetical protein
MWVYGMGRGWCGGDCSWCGLHAGCGPHFRPSTARVELVPFRFHLKLFRLADSGVKCVPFIVLFRRAVSGERRFQRFEVGHLIDFEHAPAGEASGAALSPDLKAEQARTSVLHTVVVRLNNSQFAFIDEAHLVAGFYCVQKLIMKLGKLVTYD